MSRNSSFFQKSQYGAASVISTSEDMFSLQFKDFFLVNLSGQQVNGFPHPSIPFHECFSFQDERFNLGFIFINTFYISFNFFFHRVYIYLFYYFHKINNYHKYIIPQTKLNTHFQCFFTQIYFNVTLFI